MEPSLPSPWLGAISKTLAPGLNALLNRLAASENLEALEAEQMYTLTLANAYQQRATDVHLEPLSTGWRVRYRIDGCLHNVAALPPGAGARLIRYVRTLADLDAVATFVPQDVSVQSEVEGHKLDLRLAFAPCRAGDKLAIRILDPRRVQHRLQNLGLGSEDLSLLQGWLGDICGMCLVTGPTGSGKTTTLYALVKELDLTRHSLVTIEDPVEYPLDGVSQISIDGRHGLTFAIGLRSMLRLDPDYLLVGEMRDPESAQTAVEAAGSGHFLMSTLHSPDSVGVITLLRNWRVEDHNIAAVLELVVNQRLVRRLCPKCRKEGAPSAAEKAWLTSVGAAAPAKTWRAAGCAACFQTGYHGRTGVFEIWRREESDYKLILEHADEHSLRQHIRRRGHKSILDDGLAKAAEGVTSLAELKAMGAHANFLMRPGKNERARAAKSE